MTILFNEKTISEWAYYYCLYIENIPEIRKYITDSEYAYNYCINVEDDSEVSKNITSFPFIIFYQYSNSRFIRKTEV